MTSSSIIPVLVFAYKRPDHLARVLRCLLQERVPLIIAYSDGPRGCDDGSSVAEVRRLLRAVDGTELKLIERPTNMGLGCNVLDGVSEVATRHDAFLVWEDDLVCVPGTYAWLCAALRAYANDPKVMSITGWTHPRVTPPDVGNRPYFDGRAECWVWGTWARAWKGMVKETALEKMAVAERGGVSRGAYGADLPQMAHDEARRNIWAVRWLYHHLQHGGLCLRPPWSMVEHIGFDASATNAAKSDGWAGSVLRSAPPIPEHWPEPNEQPVCRRLWQATTPSAWRRILRRLRNRL